MRLSSLAALLLAAGLPAQVETNEVSKYDRTIEYTQRSTGSQAGWCSQAFSYGLTGGLETLTSTRYTMQDQNTETREIWNVGACGINAAGDPDYASGTHYASNLRLPLNTGVRAYGVNHRFLAGAPVQVSTAGSRWHHYWQYTQATNWSTDGISLHVSWGGSWGNPPTLLCGPTGGHREIPRWDGSPQAQIIEDLTWSQQQGVPTAQSRNWIHMLWGSFDEVTLDGGAENSVYNAAPCTNPNWGWAGVDPDFADIAAQTPARYDNPAWRVQAGPSYKGGIALLLMSRAVIPGGGVSLPIGQLHLDLTDPLAGLGAVPMPPMDYAGIAEFAFDLGGPASPLRRIAADLPSWSAQALVIAPGQPQRLSNVYTMRPVLLPPGFTAGTAAQGTPGTFTKTVTDVSLALRNDGRGVLSIQQKLGTTNIGPAVLAYERAMVRIFPLSPPATSVEVSTTQTKAVDFVWALNQ